MAKIPNNFKLKMAEAFFQVSKTYRMSLHDSSLIPNEDTHKNFSDLTDEVSGTGYVSGGDDIGDPVLTQDDELNEVKVDWSDYTFTTLTVAEIRYAAIYEDTGNGGTSTIIAILDFGQNEASVAADFIVKMNAHGVLNVT